MGKNAEGIGTTHVILIGVALLTVACGRVGEDPGVNPFDSGQNAMGAAGAAGAGGSGVAPISEPLCWPPTPVDPPSPVDDCGVVPRAIDPQSTCGEAGCPIIRAFDLRCDARVYHPQLSLLGDQTLLLVSGGTYARENRLLTVTDTETELSQIHALEGVSYRLSRAAAIMWYVAQEGAGIAAVSASGEAWSKSTAVSNPSDGSAFLSGVAMVDETRGYVAYRMETRDIPHLVTWDGSCWTDETLTDTATEHLLLDVDAAGLPWTAWVDDLAENETQIVLRDPTGVTQRAYGVAQDWPAAVAESVRMLPGGVDGLDTYPTLAFLDEDGIHMVRRDAGPQADWSVVVLPESSPGSTETDCPEYSADVDPDPCGDQTSCTTQIEGNGGYFGLARTASQGTFVIWLSFSSLADSLLSVSVIRGEMPLFYCDATQTTGSGTAELVLARVGDTEPVLTRYRFDLDAGLLHLRKPVTVAARGDTLVVGAEVSGGDNPALTYFEIDSTLLP